IQSLDPKSSIDIGSSSTITASSTAPNVGNVTILLGTFLSILNGPAPPNVVVNETMGGKVQFGKNSVIALPPDNTLNAEGRNIILDSAGSGGTITLGGGVTITADPPMGMSVPAMNLAPAQNHATASSFSTARPASSAFDRQPAMPGSMSVSRFQASQATGLDVTRNELSAKMSSWALRAAAYSESKLPTALYLHHNSDGESLLLAPKADTVIETRFGKIKIDRNSLVLLQSFTNSVTVYDLDDRHRAAVSIVAGGEELRLHPGMSVTLSDSAAKGFDEVNPAQECAYRNVVRRELSGAISAFWAEFHPVALHCVDVVKRLRNSTQRNEQRIYQRLLKTTAASLQVQPQSPFRQIRKPESNKLGELAQN